MWYMVCAITAFLFIVLAYYFDWMNWNGIWGTGMWLFMRFITDLQRTW